MSDHGDPCPSCDHRDRDDPFVGCREIEPNVTVRFVLRLVPGPSASWETMSPDAARWRP